MATIPSKAVMNLLKNMRKIKFKIASILVVVEETNLDPDVFKSWCQSGFMLWECLIMLELSMQSWN